MSPKRQADRSLLSRRSTLSAHASTDLNYRDLAIARSHYHVGVEPPLIPISDGAGEIVAVGSEVTRFCIGDLACPVFLPGWINGRPAPEISRRRLDGPNDGVMAELVCLDEQEVVRAPSHLNPVEAASLPVTAVTACHCLFELGTLRYSDTIVTLGTGAVSTAAIMFAQPPGRG